jgi:tRNA pseudouridine38-40 synthase
MKSKFYYLIHLQYCGYRFHGWAKQTNVKTVHQMVDRTIRFVLGELRFKTLGSSRTDALVSANHMVFELFLDAPIETSKFLEELNINIPADIKAEKIEETDNTFNIIQSPKAKEYIYLFAFGKKHHPFAAPLMALFTFDMDIELMKQGAKLFEGSHYFKRYCTKPSPTVDFNRTIELSEIRVNDVYEANFFPESSFAYHIHSKGFMRHQIRLMMGQLILLGKGEISMKFLAETLTNPDSQHFDYIAPASGLILNKINFTG